MSLLDDLEVKGTSELEQSLSLSELTVTDKSICLSDTLLGTELENDNDI